MLNRYLLRKIPLLGSLSKLANALKSDVITMSIAMGHRATPLRAKIIILIAIAYALSPIDLLPDFIPFLGILDDVIILPLLLRLAMRQISPDIWEECRQKSHGSNLHKIKMLGMGLIMGIWGTIALIAARLWRF